MLALPLFLLAARSDAIDEWMRVRMVRDHIPAMVVGVYRDGKPLRVVARGTIDLERGTRARRDSLFEACSITKQFTAAAVLLLAEDGKLALDDPLSKWIEGAPPAWGKVTLRDALSHLSGLEDPMLEDLIARKLPAEAIERFARLAPVAVPRARWAYNNSVYELLKPVVEKASGEGMWVFLKRRVFDPVGMRDTRPNDGRVEPRRARGYVWGEAYVNADPLWERIGTSAGGLLTTADDLARWSEALRRGTVLRSASRVAMLTPGRLGSGEVAWPEVADGYGLGVFLRTVDGKTVEKHSGGWESASAQLTRLLDDGLTIVVLTNRGGLDERPWWGEEIAELVTGRRYLPSFEPVADPDPARTAKVRAMIEGLAKKGPLPALAFLRAIPQGGRTALLYRAEIEGPQIVTVWEEGGKLEIADVSSLPQTRTK